MKFILLRLFFIAVVMSGCSSRVEQLNDRKITDKEARLLATEFVNSKFQNHVWHTMLGERRFSTVQTNHWNEVIFKSGRIILRSGGSRGQEFAVSMKPDGTNIKIDHHGYSVR